MAIPALIVSGFLGAGKTLTVQQLLKQAQRDAVRLAIVPNEFDDTGPRDALISHQVIAIVVDVERVTNGIPQVETFREQLEAADNVVLNKCDLVSPEQAAAAEALLSEVTHGRPVLRAIQDAVGCLAPSPRPGCPDACTRPRAVQDDRTKPRGPARYVRPSHGA